MKFIALVFLLCLSLAFVSCGEDDAGEVPNIDLLSATVNGSNINNPNDDIPVDVTLVFVFSATLDPVAFESLFSISTGGNKAQYDLEYTNGTSKVTATATLAYNTTYNVSLGTNAIGARGEKLAQPINFSFTTAQDDVIRTMAPCTSVGACLRTVELEGSQGLGAFEYYSNYPIYEESARWENLTQAIIVVHGASHNPDDYFSYMTNTLDAQSLSESTVLISPFFRPNSAGTGADFYWSNTGWRRGNESTNSNKISSFKVVDELIRQLANSENFPVLDKIIVTGHSSGAAFTHVYAAANISEVVNTNLTFEYIVANSQFMYYPDDQRINESNNQLYTPTGCTAMNIWPLGFNATPPYLNGTSESTFNTQFAGRSITYLLGNGNQSDPTLNTRDCENILQGSSRYKRGANMFRYMELVYPSQHNHARVEVDGIGHDGQGMYQSTAFKTLLSELLQ